MRSRRKKWALLVVLLLAVGLRVWGCFGQGYPHSFYPDEQTNVMRAMQFGARGNLDPDWFNKPALGYYMLFAEYGAWYLGGRILGAFQDSEDFAVSFISSRGPFYLVGRLTMSLLALLSVYLCFLLGRRLYGTRTGLLAALVLALSAAHVHSSQQVKMDVLATLFTIWSALFLAGIMKRGRRRDYLLAGGLAGLGMATKYYPVILVVPLVFAHFFRTKRALRRAPRMFLSPRLGSGLLAMLVGFFVGSPYNFINPRFREWLGAQMRFVLQRFVLGSSLPYDSATNPRGVVVEGSLWDSLRAFLEALWSPEGLGPLFCLLLVAGIILAMRQRRRRDAFLLVTAASVALLLVVANRQYTQPRHLNILLPFAAILAGRGFAALLSRIRFGASPLPLRGLGAVLLLLATAALPVPGFPIRVVAARNLANLRPDPRMQFLNWFEKNIPAGETVINDFGKIPLVPNAGRCRWVIQRVRRLVQREHAIGKDRAAGYRIWWRLREKALKNRKKPGYDVLILDHQWQQEHLAERLTAGSTYNPIWPHSPWSWVLGRVLFTAWKRGELVRQTAASVRKAFLASLPKQERDLGTAQLWTRSTRPSRPFLLSPRAGARYLVSTRITYDNYQTPHKRSNFPDFAAFYDDLNSHYTSFEFNSGDSDPSRVIRLYDLRRRQEHPRRILVSWSFRLPPPGRQREKKR